MQVKLDHLLRRIKYNWKYSDNLDRCLLNCIPVAWCCKYTVKYIPMSWCKFPYNSCKEYRKHHNNHSYPHTCVFKHVKNCYLKLMGKLSVFKVLTFLSLWWVGKVHRSRDFLRLGFVVCPLLWNSGWLCCTSGMVDLK